MASVEDESNSWEHIVAQLQTYSDLDPILRAVDDCRIRQAAHYSVYGGDQSDEGHLSELLAQIKEEYFLEPNEVLTALEIAEDRIVREQA